MVFILVFHDGVFSDSGNAIEVVEERAFGAGF
jgi:hypothetical protein